MTTGVFTSIRDYSKMIKLSHSLFALPFAGLSAVMALSQSNLTLEEALKLLFWIVICMVSARSAAMGFNRYVDREFDKKNERTKVRELPSGKISEKAALAFIIFSSLLFLFGSYMINFKCFLLSFPALFIILFYSLSKRFTFLCHFILGLGIGIAPSGAWIAILDKLELVPALWSFGLMFHIAGFDILYAMQDMDFDRQEGLYSIPAKFGLDTSFWIARLSHLFSFSLLLLAGYYAGLGMFYYIFLGIVAVLFLLEHSMVSREDLSKLPIAFFHINASISIILFLGILLDKGGPLLQKFGLL